ncbi:MAG: hypothetical protein GVY19_13515 [Bacteroidetes bacterium]|jgi:hypothetical protein|nr:hypothetical protein [Bacteroidota bacterium]
MDLESEYYLLLIDIKDSTRISNEWINDSMHVLDEQLNVINKYLQNDIAIPLSINYGDEIAGLFHATQHLYRAIFDIRRLFSPRTSIRFVVTKGTVARLSTDIRKVGGIVFKKANTAMESLKKENKYCAWQIQENYLDKVLMSLCEMSNMLLENMSDYQKQIFYLLHDGFRQKDIAIKLDKHVQSVWDAIQRSKMHYVIEAEKSIHLMLQQPSYNP